MSMSKPLIVPADLARFLVAFGLPPLLLAREFARGLPPWTIALTPGWSADQIIVSGLVAAVLGATTPRPAHGLAAVALGTLLGLAADLWWFAGWVQPDDQAFVTMLPRAEWQSRMTMAALLLLASVGAGFLLGATVRVARHDRPGISVRRPTRPEVLAVGLAVIGGWILALGLGATAATSPLVVPDGAQIQTVVLSAGAITVEPADLRPGPTRFRCQFRFGVDAPAFEALLVAIPVGADPASLTPPFNSWDGSCGPSDYEVTQWGTVGDLRSGRYVWVQIDNSSEVQRTVATSGVVAVSP